MTVTPEVVFAAVGFLLIPGLRPTNRAANTDGLLESLSQSFTSDSDRQGLTCGCLPLITSFIILPLPYLLIVSLLNSFASLWLKEKGHRG